MTPGMLVIALLRAFGGDKVDTIAGLHRYFNGLLFFDVRQVAYKPFHNQLPKPAFPCL